MKLNKITVLFTLVCVFLLNSTFAGETWMVDYNAARAKAAEENKPLLLDFTGSDWCPPCLHINKTVFSQKAFKDYVKDAYVLVKLDFPRRTPQSAELALQNDALYQKYAVEGLPSILVLSPKGEVVDRSVGVTGAMRTPETYVAYLKQFAAN